MRKKVKNNKNLEEELPFENESGSGAMKHFLDNSPIYIGLFFLCFFVFSLSSLFGLAGSLGANYFNFITGNLGAFAYPLPLLYLFLSASFFSRRTQTLLHVKTLSLGIFSFCLFVLISFFGISGKLGTYIGQNMSDSFGLIPTLFLLVLVSIGSLAKAFETSLEDILGHKFSFTKNLQNTKLEVMEEVNLIEKNIIQTTKDESNFFGKMFSGLAFWKAKSNEIQTKHVDNYFSDSEDEYEEVEMEEEAEEVEDSDVRTSMYKAAGVELSKEEKEKVKIKKLVKKENPNETIQTKKENEEKLRQVKDQYERPPINLYTSDSGKSSAGDNKENARIIKRTLADFGISVEMDEVTVGPTVTRYALKPAQGVKIEKIINLGNNIALELGVTSVSITRIPERSLIGIEVPNKQKSMLGISNLLGSKQFNERKERLTLAFGKDIYGEPVFTDMAKMPHLLVAGTTGSGKSVLVHGLINSLIYKNSPYDLKFILIDPKKVEFALYGNLPHLYTPIIKEPKKAIQTLNWLVQEMDRRYQILEDFGKQNIASYHTFVAEKYQKVINKNGQTNEKLPEKMPYIVLVIDELADFMMKYPKEMESGIVKLAQMSRAVGIHLILATQRPSTNIITGVIKGNIPSRVALRVASQVDSRVIIDQGGAEKLLGYGDMLLQTADGAELRRIQSPNISEDEIKDVVAYLREKYDDVVTEDLKARDGNIVGSQNISGGNGGTVDDQNFSEEDDKYDDAKQVVLQTKKTSISNLQVRLGTGYARSAKLINMLESAGVIITVNDNNGKQVKVVAGTENKNENLEAEANKLLEKEEGVPESQEVLQENKKQESVGFFRF